MNKNDKQSEIQTTLPQRKEKKTTALLKHIIQLHRVLNVLQQTGHKNINQI